MKQQRASARAGCVARLLAIEALFPTSVSAGAIVVQMGTPAIRDELLEQIRGLGFEDREYIEAALLRDGFEDGRRQEPPALVAELERRAIDALAHPGRGASREEAVARALAVVEAVRARKL